MGTHGLFVLLCTLQYIQWMHGSALLDSLTCVNNYNTHWKCQWKLSEKSHELLPMKLVHWNNLTSWSSDSQTCEPDDSPKIKDGEIYMTCQINAIFGYTMTTTYTFQPKRDVRRMIHLHPNSNVRMPPPEGLMVQMSGSKNDSVLLRWRMPDNISYPKLLLYQVTYYRKDWESWEDAAVLDVMGKTEVSFSAQLFVPGSTYLFRVRSVPDKQQLYRSAWSDNITWTMPEEEDKAIPQNLRCEYDGATRMECRWEIREELSPISYMLYYKDDAVYGTKTPARGGKPCNNLSSQRKDGSFYVLYSCTFQITSSQANNSFHIEVRPKEELKELIARQHVQTDPPTDLQLKDPLKYKYKLGWNPPAVVYPSIKLTYQLCYWKQGDDECLDLILVTGSGMVPEYYLPSSELLSSTIYTAKVRAKLDIDSGLNGPWSEWSQICSWKTDKGVKPVSISVATFFASVAVLLCIYLGFTYFKKCKEQWENSIPDPRKSKPSNFSLGYRGGNFPHFISWDFYAEVEGPLVPLQISSIEPLDSTCEVSEEFMVETSSTEPSVSPLGPCSITPPTAENDQNHQASSTLPNSEGTHDLEGASISQPKISSNNPYFIFNGTQSMSDLIPKQSKSSEYFMLPKCQSKMFRPPKEFSPSCMTRSPSDQMGYVFSMEKHPPLQKPLKNNDSKQESKKSSYFSIPAPSDVQVLQEGPTMVINPDETGPLVLKQVGDYCFFPGIQENFERKMAKANGNMPSQMPKGAPLPAVQTFKVMQRDYLAIPQN